MARFVLFKVGIGDSIAVNPDQIRLAEPVPQGGTLLTFATDQVGSHDSQPLHVTDDFPTVVDALSASD